jgi:hypothetical protein
MKRPRALTERGASEHKQIDDPSNEPESRPFAWNVSKNFVHPKGVTFQ